MEDVTREACDIVLRNRLDLLTTMDGIYYIVHDNVWIECVREMISRGGIYTPRPLSRYDWFPADLDDLVRF